MNVFLDEIFIAKHPIIEVDGKRYRLVNSYTEYRGESFGDEVMLELEEIK